MEHLHPWERWSLLAQSYTADSKVIESLFKAITAKLGEPHRFYHNMAHVKHLLDLIEEYAERITEMDALRFAAWYHDIIYEPVKPTQNQKSNEENSALLAEQHLYQLKVPLPQINRITALIRATETHSPTPDIVPFDGNFFLDADLAILGAAPETYLRYQQAIRKEYAHVPDEAYRNGRASLLRHFLQKETIFKTPALRSTLEPQARKNIRKELDTLET